MKIIFLIQVPYIFNQLEAPNETQTCVHALLTREIIHKYGGNSEFAKPYFGRAFKNSTEGYMPEMDEDDGTMGAWYVFSAMGMYPLKVGVPEYELVSPIFDKITLKLKNGKTFVIKTKNRKALSDFVKNKTLNGKDFQKWQISHEKVLEGGVLEFVY
ncbi:MAG: glycoside hydrolase domain-containing protein [Paludibacter sp.]